MSEIQCREDDGKLTFWGTLAEARQYAKETPEVWKISFTADTGERVRLVRKQIGEENMWSWEPLEEIVEELRKAIDNA